MGSEGGLDALLDGARCVVAVGPGGVGKTSTSAAIAIEAARRGQRAVVLTIDPARRLANALGLPEIGSVETEIRGEAFARAGLEPPQGRLTALMLDIAEAWDDVVTRYHPDPEQRRQLLDNRLYRTLSTALAGSQEYMAMEKLHRLATRDDDRPDLIVLDTPPATHALDFLEAPSRMVEALDNDATRWILHADRSRKGLPRRVFESGGNLFVRTIARFTGAEILEELAELLGAFSAMFDGFRERARVVGELLARPDTRMVVVSSPSPTGLDDARAFVELLEGRRVHVGAVVLNRATTDPFADGAEAPDRLREAVLAAGAGEALFVRLEGNAREGRRRAAVHREGARALAASVAPRPVVLAPELPREVSDLASLELLRRALFEPAPLHPGSSPAAP